MHREGVTDHLGKTVDRRDQVFGIRFSPDAFMASIFFNSWSE